MVDCLNVPSKPPVKLATLTKDFLRKESWSRFLWSLGSNHWFDWILSHRNFPDLLSWKNQKHSWSKWEFFIAIFSNMTPSNLKIQAFLGVFDIKIDVFTKLLLQWFPGDWYRGANWPTWTRKTGSPEYFLGIFLIFSMFLWEFSHNKKLSGFQKNLHFLHLWQK